MLTGIIIFLLIYSSIGLLFTLFCHDSLMVSFIPKNHNSLPLTRKISIFLAGGPLFWLIYLIALLMDL